MGQVPDLGNSLVSGAKAGTDSYSKPQERRNRQAQYALTANSAGSALAEGNLRDQEHLQRTLMNPIALEQSTSNAREANANARQAELQAEAWENLGPETMSALKLMPFLLGGGIGIKTITKMLGRTAARTTAKKGAKAALMKSTAAADALKVKKAKLPPGKRPPERAIGEKFVVPKQRRPIGDWRP